MSEVLQGLIVLPHLRVQNANAVSGPLTWGFPAITAFTGWAHAMQRRLGGQGGLLDGVGVVCHRFDPQIYYPNPFQTRFSLARHPMGKDGKPTGTVEEGRAHLELTLLLGVRGYLDQREGKALAREVMQTALGMRLAGGSVLPAGDKAPMFIELGDSQVDHEEAYARLRWKLLPGFVLLDRSEVLEEHLSDLREQDPAANALDALLDLSSLKWEPQPSEPEAGEEAASADRAEVPWRAFRARQGWLVPIPIGYGAISPTYGPGKVKNARDNDTPFCFVEALYSLGEWMSPHRVPSPHQMLWTHQARHEDGVYICKQMQSI